MKTAVIGEDEDGRVVYNRTLGEFARHYGYLPKACRAYRPETKGKVERPFRYIREDFFLGGTFRDLDDLNAQFARWLSSVANPRLHASTGRIVNEAFAEERRALRPSAVQRKVTNGYHAKWAADAGADLRSKVDTASHAGNPPFKTIIATASA
jgi:hypothetical protein